MLNNLNRGMGLQDAYPFVLPTPAVEKLRFVHDVIAELSAERPARLDFMKRLGFLSLFSF